MHLTYLYMFMFLVAAPLAANADPDGPQFGTVSEPAPPFAVERLVTSGGMTLLERKALKLEPEFGFGYGNQKIEQAGGSDLVRHRVDALAGGKLKILDAVYLSAAAKLPVYSFEAGSSRGAGPARSTYSRHDYDLLRAGSALAWTGELGINLGVGTELSLFYDQDILNPPAGTVMESSDNRFGTRLIFRFR